jgi:hypothetical protein
MRAVTLLMILPISVCVAEPKPHPPFSRSDVRQICALVASVTSERIVGIQGLQTTENGPGAIPRFVYTAPDGRRVWTYERADVAFATTGKGNALFTMYKVEKTQQRWKLIDSHPVEKCY